MGETLLNAQPRRAKIWTIAEAKARLSEILRLADEEGPQQIGLRKTFFVVSSQTWRDRVRPRKPLGQFLVENLRGLGELELPNRKDPNRRIPFMDDEGDQ